MITGHSPSLSASNNTKTSKTDAQQTQRSLVSIETHEYLLTWSEVSTATHYVILRDVIKADSPTKSFLTSTVHKENSLTTSYQYELISGDYEFKVIACTDSSPLLICGGRSKTRITSIPPDTSPEESLQPQDVIFTDDNDVPFSGNDAVVAHGEHFKLKWLNPPNTGDSDKILAHFEVYGELSGKIAEVAVRGGETYQYEVERNSGIRVGDAPPIPVLDSGRQYCYKVLPIYRVSDANWTLVAGEAAYPDPTQCMTIDKIAFEAPSALSVFNQIPNSDTKATYSVPVTWSPITTSPAPQNYLVEIQYPFETGVWRSVYYGPESYTSLRLSGGNQVIRVSACDENDVCGNYRRIYFWNYSNFSSDSSNKTASCFNIPTNVVGDNQIPVNWCPALAPDVDEYEILNRAGNSLYSTNTQLAELKPNGIVFATINNLFGPEEDHRCLSLWTKYRDGTSTSSTVKCLETTPNTPTNVNASITTIEPAESLVQWDSMTGAYRYYINSGFCDNNCSEPTYWDTYASLYNAPTQMSLNLDKGAGKYFYKVTACSQTNKCSAASEVKTITFTGPTAPVNLAVNLVAPSIPTYELLWDASIDASSYIIEQASCSDSSCSGISDSDWSQIDTSTTNQYTLPQVTSTYYAYSVTACHSICGPRSAQLNVDYTKPATPTGITINVIDASQGSHSLNWNVDTVGEVTEYKVQWAVCDTDCVDVTEADWNLSTTVISTNSWAFTVATNEYRTFKVAACRASGICSNFSFAVDMPRNARSIRFIHTDNLGSPVSETDKNGN